jgi:hypothetical protein
MATPRRSPKKSPPTSRRRTRAHLGEADPAPPSADERAERPGPRSLKGWVLPLPAQSSVRRATDDPIILEVWPPSELTWWLSPDVRRRLLPRMRDLTPSRGCVS